MYPALGVSMAGAALVAFGQAYWPVTLGTFLVGLGWAAANVAATAYIADHATTLERGRMIGLSDSWAGATSVLAAVLTGPIMALGGIGWAGILALALTLLPAIFLPQALLARRA
jgi:MFS family permease